MSKITRAKFTCVKVEALDEGSNVKLEPVTSGGEENDSFFKWTPFGSIEIGTINPNVKFEEGKEYYVDFSEAGE